MKLSIPQRQRGQGMTEYIIIVAFVAILSIAVVTLFGDNVRALFGTSANALRGVQTSPSDLGGREVTEEDVRRDASHFGEGP